MLALSSPPYSVVIPLSSWRIPSTSRSWVSDWISSPEFYLTIGYGNFSALVTPETLWSSVATW